MRWLAVLVGALAVVTGVIWTLQGLDVMGGSAMSGKTLWAVVGPIVVLVGIALVVVGIRKRAAPPS